MTGDDDDVPSPMDEVMEDIRRELVRKVAAAHEPRTGKSTTHSRGSEDLASVVPREILSRSNAKVNR